MDAYSIRKKIIKKYVENSAFVISSEDKFVTKITNYNNFFYMILMDGEEYYIVHEAQDDGSKIKNAEKIVTMDPDSALKKIVGTRDLISTHPELVKIPNVKPLNLENIFRKPYDDEIPIIREGVSIFEQSLERAMEKISIGMKEYEIRAEIDYELLKSGFESFTYPTVVLTGEKTSIPLGRTGNRVLEKGDILQIDVSPIYKGYDLSIARIIFTEINDELNEMFKKYNRIFELVSSQIKPGVKCSDIDSFVRDYFNNLGIQFPHFSGYPLGGFTSPFIYPESKDVLERNSVFVFSPGMYIKNRYGFRIKRLIHVNDHSFETFDKLGE